MTTAINTTGSERSMTAMARRGRPPSYTAEEDEIILATTGLDAAVTDIRLRAAGFPARTSDAYTSRRRTLRQQGEETGEDDLSPAEYLAHLARRHEILEGTLDAVSAELAEVKEKLRDAIAAAAEQLKE